VSRRGRVGAAPKFKFDWIHAVATDLRIGVTERFILTQIGVYYVTSGTDFFCVRQTTVADKFAVGERSVKKAFAAGRRLGHLVLDEPRKRGTGHHGGNRYRLVIPAQDAPTSEELGAQHAPNSEEVGGTDCKSYGHRLQKLGARANAPTSGNDVPKGINKGFGGRVRAAAPPPPPTSQPTPTPGVGPETDGDDDEIGAEPSRYCRRHPDGTDDPCGGCRKAREDWEDWDENRRDVLEERRVINACPLCDGDGVRLDPDGEPLTIPRRGFGGVTVQSSVFCDHRRHDPDCADCAGTGSRILGVGSCRCKPRPKTHTASTARRFGDLCTVCADVELWSPPEIARGVCAHCLPLGQTKSTTTTERKTI
jgi:hypothetical protein